MEPRAEFVDHVRVYARAGRGGNGCLSFRREKFAPRGGPDGGNGGDGGSVILKADAGARTLLHLSRHPHLVASDGGHGRSALQTGPKGRDAVAPVPCGTLVYRVEKNGRRLVADLTEPGQTVVVARGGRGGRGNASFKSGRRPAPRIVENGQPGEEATLDLELLTLADVGIVGFPNSGKSTLLSVISSARPKVADYPFTTLAPNLGVVRWKDRTSVWADLPGLIEGASEGRGLGLRFLRHAERTRLLVHLVDPLGFGKISAARTIAVLREELRRYGAMLSRKPRILVFSKQDVTEARTAAAKLRRRFRGAQAISAVTGQGLERLLREVHRILEKIPPLPPRMTPADSGPVLEAEAPFEIRRDGSVFVVEGGEVARWVAMTPLHLPEARARLQARLARAGVEKALRRAGIRPGDAVRIGKWEFEYADETAETVRR